MDNQSAITLTENPILSQRSKHIDIKYHFIREQVKNKTIKPIYLPTDNMIADPLTKSIGAQQLKRVIKGLIGKP